MGMQATQVCCEDSMKDDREKDTLEFQVRRLKHDTFLRSYCINILIYIVAMHKVING